MTTRGTGPLPKDRASYLAALAIAVLLSIAVGAPGFLVGLNGLLGLKGWQWLFIIGGAGTLCTLAILWAPSSAWLSGSAAADVIALINSIGNLAGSGGPYLIGGGKQAASNISAALLALGVLLLIACLPVLLAGQYQD
jgi:hypothetical protein